MCNAFCRTITEIHRNQICFASFVPALGIEQRIRASSELVLTNPRRAELFMAAPMHPKAAMKKINAPAAIHKFAAFAQLYCSQISA